MILLCIGSFNISSFAQIEFADVILDSYYSGAHPGFNTFYGINLSEGCDEYIMSINNVLGNNDNLVAFPTGSYVTVGFVDNIVYNAPNQDDLFIEEPGAADELADIYVSPDGVNFTLLGEINGGITNALDLEDYGYNDIVTAVKVVGKDNDGCIPGFDIVRIYGLEGAFCAVEASVSEPADICSSAGLINLRSLVDDFAESAGKWEGPNVTGWFFDPEGLEGDYVLQYIVNHDIPVCENDTAYVTFHVDYCDCAGEIDGPLLLDDCGQCLDPSDPDFSVTCIDCNGVAFGDAVIDYCGNCLSPSHPDYNNTCPEKYLVYIPNTFSPNGTFNNREFRVSSDFDLDIVIQDYEIYDRWGSLVYSANNIALDQVNENNGPWWDGRYKNTITNNVFVYRIAVLYTSGEIREFTGAVTVVN